MGAEQQIAFFLRELKDGDTWRRAAAAKGPGRVGRDEHAWVLVASAGDRTPEVREAVAAGLGRLGVAEAGRRVLPVLMGDQDPWVRRRASRAAIQLGPDSPAIVDACTRLLRDPDRHLRINALDGRPASETTSGPGATSRTSQSRNGSVAATSRATLSPSTIVRSSWPSGS